MQTSRLSYIAAAVTAVFLAMLAGMAVSRVLYEAMFPAAAALGRPLPVLMVALTAGGLGWLGWRGLAARGTVWGATAVYLPFLLNLGYLFSPMVDPLRSRLLLLGSMWLAALLATYVRWPHQHRMRDVGFLLAFLAPVYLLTLGQTVGKADTFEFQVVVPQLGIAHPTGYPLYLLLTKLFTYLPFGEMAWRVNVGTAVYALAAVLILYELVSRLTHQPLAALATALTFGLTPTFWSQAIAAEVYTLHSLIVALALFLMREVGDWRVESRDWGLREIDDSRVMTKDRTMKVVALAFVLGLGLTNHLTTLILIPPAILTVFFTWYSNRQSLSINQKSLIVLPAFLLPLTLYAYLPLRWQAVVGEPMGFGRFGEWVIGGRFQGALQLMAWRRDPVRYEVVARLFTAEWHPFLLLAAAIGLFWLAWRCWPAALVLFTTWLGFSFYALSYYVPDLNVFLIPAHLLIALAIGTAFAFIINLQSFTADRLPITVYGLLLTAVLIPTPATWTAVDNSARDGLTQWGRAVLSLPLADAAAILADSEKIAPLEYLHSAEGIRPDLDISVWPDEAAYRAQLEARIATGQTVYLARFLPGLAGSYHLRSAGPLTEVATAPLTTLPDSATAANLTIGPLKLIGYELHRQLFERNATAVTLYWQATAPTPAPQYIYMRWANGAPVPVSGQHPANNDYPTNAWRPGEIVPDFHLLPQPLGSVTRDKALQVAIAPPFTAAGDLEWQTITEITLPPSQLPQGLRPYRAQIGSLLIDGGDFPATIRPGTPLPITLTGYGATTPDIQLTLVSTDSALILNHPSSISNSHSPAATPFIWETEVTTGVANGRYHLIAQRMGETAVCGWLRPISSGCVLGEVTLSGIALPASATNFDDKIALLDVTVPDAPLAPGSQLPITLNWQALDNMTADYTIFAQVLDANDRIVGQTDVWPRQGTYPTSQWQPGETITDPIIVQLDGDLPSGDYRLILGWYLLADLRRLPVLDATGSPIADRYVLSGLVVP